MNEVLKYICSDNRVSINDYLPSDEKERKDYVDSFISNFNWISSDFEDTPVKRLDSLKSRINSFYEAANSGKKSVILFYERFCGDDPTFRYFGENIKEACSSSSEWHVEIFFDDEVDKIENLINLCNLGILIRMRQSPNQHKFVEYLHKHNKLAAFLIDDYCVGENSFPFLVDSLNLNLSSQFEIDFWKGVALRFKYCAMECDCIIASNKYLADHLGMELNKKTFVIHSTINNKQLKTSNILLNNKKKKEFDISKEFYIAYFSGTDSHNKDFAIWEDSLYEFLLLNDGARLILGGKLKIDKRLASLINIGKVIPMPFVDYITLQKLQAVSDIVLSPLIVNKFTNCKSALKLFEAGVVGTPCIASNSFSCNEYIRDNNNGWICTNNGEFVKILNNAYNNRSICKEYGLNASKISFSKYSTEHLIKECEKVFSYINSIEFQGDHKFPDNLMNEICKTNLSWSDQSKINVCYANSKAENFNKLDKRTLLNNAISKSKALFYKSIKKPNKKLGSFLRKCSLIDISEKLINKIFRNRPSSSLGNKLKWKTFSVQDPQKPAFYDVLFVNGCDLSVPHPVRYRVDHQIEQLEAQGLKCKRIDVWNLNEFDAGSARNIIIFRCPYGENIEHFIKIAKKLNKKVYFDIDDLVFDEQYAESLEAIKEMSIADRQNYFNGVNLMKRTMIECDGAITTTNVLCKELKNYHNKVFINRNVASSEMVKLSEDAIKSGNPHDENVVKIGYFSGSITHNEDFKLIIPALLKIFNKYNNVYLVCVGHLDIPHELKNYESRIIFKEFCDWRRLPELIASVDINLAPIKSNLFNSAKSENKWLEASLVKVPTIASNVGSFSDIIINNKTGILSNDNEWYDSLLRLIKDSKLRKSIANNAYKFCHENYISIYSGKSLADFIYKNQSPNVLMVLNNLDNTGGCMVAKKHCEILQNSGYDVTIGLKLHLHNEGWAFINESFVPTRYIYASQNKYNRNMILGSVDNAVATFWETVDYLKYITNCKKKSYLVQGYEPDFFDYGTADRLGAYSTYFKNDLQYITISKWCQSWLKNKFSKDARYAPNGIDLKFFPCINRDFSTKKIRILIEGDCNVDHKNIDEAFKIVEHLDENKFEIWYLSYGNTKKDWYRIDKFFGNVPHSEVYKIYQNCHILLKTSLHESFSYPPLEMMATGGYVVAIPNEGNVEYLKNNYNCLFFDSGDIKSAIKFIKKIVRDPELRKILESNGAFTVEKYSWSNNIDKVISLYKA